MARSSSYAAVRRISFALLVAVSFLLIPYAPARGQNAVFHHCAFFWEDGDPKHDAGPEGVKDGVLVFAAGKTHVIYRCDAWGDQKIVFQPGAIVKFASKPIYSADSQTIIGYEPATDGWLRANTLPASVEINGATLTDIRDDTVGGDTNNDGDATMPPQFGGYSLTLNASPANSMTGATIKYLAWMGGFGSMNITGNTFLSFGGFRNPGGTLIPSGVPTISNNKFELSCFSVGVDMRGLAAKIENNTFSLAQDPKCTSFASVWAITLGPRPTGFYPETDPWGPERGAVVVAGNTFEVPNGIRIEDFGSYRGAFEGKPFRAEIRNNKLRGVNPATGIGWDGLNLDIAADATVEGNEVANFSRPFAVSYTDSTKTARLRVNNNRFSLEGASPSSGPGNSLWTKGILVNAENNYWGDASGPYDPSKADTVVDRRLYNPRGRGLRVGDGIDYVPFIGGTVKAPEGYLKIAVSASPAAPLPPDGDATFTVAIQDYLLRSAPRGRIVVTIRDADGYVIHGTSGIDVTNAERAATIPNVQIKVPDDSPFVTVEAGLVPEGEGDAARSNIERFTVSRPTFPYPTWNRRR